ncbi:hypothetical protein [Pedobacter namyangjuensis]|uniref:hypothetical protein n=1 Tax=Pedobacter namyangjuensis TaxID=600626 RepID=UPI0013B44A1D|nr:hypothetical protein [Pedobacter namyangjuensis]
MNRRILDTQGTGKFVAVLQRGINKKSHAQHTLGDFVPSDEVEPVPKKPLNSKWVFFLFDNPVERH